MAPRVSFLQWYLQTILPLNLQRSITLENPMGREVEVGILC